MFSVRLVSCYAHVFVQLSIVIVTLSTYTSTKNHIDDGILPKLSYRRHLRSSDIATFVVPRTYTLSAITWRSCSNTWLKTVNSLQLLTGVSFDRRTLLRLLLHVPTLVSAIGHSQLLDHSCGTAFRPTYDSPTLPFIGSGGR